MAEDVMRMLRSVPIFEGLSEKELRSVVETGKEIGYPPGHQIVQEGTTGLGFHLILDGRAKVTIRGEAVATVGPGDYFGEMSLIDGGPRSATVEAETELRTLSLTSWGFMPLLDANPSIARKMLVELSRRLRAVERSHTH